MRHSHGREAQRAPDSGSSRLPCPFSWTLQIDCASLRLRPRIAALCCLLGWWGRNFGTARWPAQTGVKSGLIKNIHIYITARHHTKALSADGAPGSLNSTIVITRASPLSLSSQRHGRGPRLAPTRRQAGMPLRQGGVSGAVSGGEVSGGVVGIRRGSSCRAITRGACASCERPPRTCSG